MVAHELCVDQVEADAAKPWSHDCLRAEMDRDPLLRPSYAARARAMADFASWRAVVPAQTFPSRLTLADGVELEHVGGRHTPESTIVRVPRDGVVFLGDCYYPPPYHLRSPDDHPDLDLLQSIISDDYEWYVESHAPPWRPADLR